MAKDTGETKISDLVDRLKMSDSMVQVYRKRLINQGVIASEHRGYLSFVVPYLDEHLRGEF